MFDRTRHRAQLYHPVTQYPTPHLAHFRQQSQPPFSNIQDQWNHGNPSGPSYLPPYPPHPYAQQQGVNPYPYSQNPMNNHAQGIHGANLFYHNHMQQYGPAKQQSYAQSIFQNPLEPEKKPSQTANPYMNPYPKQSFIPKQPSGVQSIMNSFKTQDGTLDFNKVMDTAGNMINAVSQVSSMVKGLGGIIKV